MTNKSFEWDAVAKQFNTVDDPVSNIDDSDYDACIFKAGYSLEFGGEEEDSVSGSVKVYSNFKPELPRFFIDIMGQNGGIATLVARDFPSLLATLQQIQPFLTLVGCDQFTAARCIDRIEGGR